MTTKLKLSLLAGLSVLGLVILVILSNISVNKTNELDHATVMIKQLNSDMLMLRRNEKDFILRKDMKYKDKFEKNVENLNKNLKELESILLDNNIDTSKVNDLKDIINEYRSSFFNYTDKQKEIGLNHNSGLYGSLRDAVHQVQDFAKKAEDYKLLSAVYDLRKQEKDFMLRRDMKYVDKFTKKIDKLIPKTTNNSMMSYLETYKKDFLALVKAENEIGLNSKVGIQGHMRDIIHKSETLLKEMTKESIQNVQHSISSLKVTIEVVSFLIIVLIIGLFFIIIRSIVIQIDTFEEGLLGFFRYLNREAQNVERIDIHSNDEIGTMAKVVNENIVITQKGIEEDRKVIDETIAVLSEFEEGDLCQRVNIHSNNPALAELIRLLNQMGSNIEININNVLSVLEQYSNSNYLNKVETDGMKEHLLKLINGVNTLR